MSDVLIMAVVAGIAFAAGWHSRGIVIIANMLRNPENMIKMLTEFKKILDEERASGVTIDDDAIILSVEEQAGMVYLFQADNNRFVAQGKTIELALATASERFPGKKFWHPKVKEDHQSA